MTTKPGGSRAVTGNGTASGAVPLSRPAASLLSVLRVTSSDRPLKQLAAGYLIGMRGKEKTIESKVQRLRDEITEKTGQVVCGRWSPPKTAGMWLPANEAEEDDYIGRCLARAYKTIARFKGLDTARRRRILEDVQGVLGFDADAKEVAPVPVQGENASKPCTAKRRPGQRHDDGQLTGMHCWCGKGLRGRQTVACSDLHRDIHNGRQKP